MLGRFGSAVIGGVLLSTVASTGVAAAAAPPSASLVGLTDGQRVSGVVDVSLSITAAEGTTIQNVHFRLWGAGSSSPGLTGEVIPAAGECAGACTVHWSANTAAVESLRTDAADVAAVPDGRAGFEAWVVSSAGTTDVTAFVTVDNHRPTLMPASPPSTVVPYFSGDKQISVSTEAAPSSEAGVGTSLSDVQLEVPGASWPLVHLAPAGDGKIWNAQVDTSSIPDGDYPAQIVATDSDGVTSAGERVHVVVDHHFMLDAPVDGTVGPNWSTDQLLYGYPGWANCYPSDTFQRPVRIEVKLDGALWHSAKVDRNDTSYGPSGNNCAVRAAGSDAAPLALPLGKHTLTYVVTDNNGVQETATRNVDVALPLKAIWPTAFTAVAAGGTVKLTPTVTAPDHTSKLAHWTIAYRGKTLASGNAPSLPSLTYTAPVTELVYGELVLTVASNVGITSQSSTWLASQWHTRTVLHASAAKVARGGAVTLRALPWGYVDGSWTYLRTVGANVYYQWSYPGGPWHTGPRFTVGPVTTAPATLKVRPWRTICYRTQWTFWDYFLSSTSNTVCITVK